MILSSTVPPGGYYLPANRSEVMQFIRTLENRSLGTMEALQSARKYLQQFPPGGYYLPANRSEVMQFIRTLENRSLGTMEALQSARKYLQQFPE